MKQDKAIIKVLKSMDEPSLSDGFNSLMMNQIYRAVIRKKMRANILNLCLLSTVSLGLISLGIYMLKDYLAANFIFQLPTLNNLSESISRYSFSVYIAILIFILVGLDSYFRNIWKKHNGHKSGQLN